MRRASIALKDYCYFRRGRFSRRAGRRRTYSRARESSRLIVRRGARVLLARSRARSGLTVSITALRRGLVGKCAAADLPLNYIITRRREIVSLNEAVTSRHG